MLHLSQTRVGRPKGVYAAVDEKNTLDLVGRTLLFLLYDGQIT
jgi:hypothetical protein